MKEESSLKADPDSPPTNISNNLNEKLNENFILIGLEKCPQCQKPFNISRPVRDFCDHFKCRICFINKEEEKCVQCCDANKNTNGGKELEGSPHSPATSSSNNNDLNNKKKKTRNPFVFYQHITILDAEESSAPMYQCNVCTKKFKTKAHIKYHKFCQKGEKPFKCEDCGQGFIMKSHYDYHLRTHSGEKPFICPECGKGFNQQGKVTRHMKSHTGEKPHICQQCKKGFTNAQALKSHTLIHTGERPFACQYCNKRFTGMTNLKRHVITHTGERPFDCKICEKSFGLKWTLDLHILTHSSKSDRSYACDKCSKAFSNSKVLKRHSAVHSGLRPFKCGICSTKFRRKDNLNKHIKNIHKLPKELNKELANEAAAAADYKAMARSKNKRK